MEHKFIRIALAVLIGDYIARMVMKIIDIFL